MTFPASPANSSAIERDARLVNTRHDKVRPGEIAIGVIIGRTSEFFDFFVYAIASVLVFPSVVFPYVDPLTGMPRFSGLPVELIKVLPTRAISPTRDCPSGR